MANSTGDCYNAEQGVLDVKPLRTLTPMFPAPSGVNVNTFHLSMASPFISTTPAGPFNGFSLQEFTTFAQGVQFSTASGLNGTSATEGCSNIPILATPVSIVKNKTPSVSAVSSVSEEEDEELFSSVPEDNRPPHLSSYSMGEASHSDGSNGKKIKRPRPSYTKVAAANGATRLPTHSDDPRETVEALLMTFDALRRRHLQLDEAQSSRKKRADLKAGVVMMGKDLRANASKRVGAVPGVEIGDIFFFRMELCLVGLHAPSMAGIDFISPKNSNESEPLAICVVSSGGYENEDDDVNMLVYSGQGLNDKDQKLERGNLAMERSTIRKNEIRVVRGAKDPFCTTNKIYIYDGIYRIHESWKEKTKTGFSGFKYRLIREPGQPDGIAVWKMTRCWMQNPSYRGRMLLPDLSSGAEQVPVCLVNEVDDEKGPSYFTYVTQVKHLRPIGSMQRMQGCNCLGTCLSGDGKCSCAQHNGSYLPYSSTGLLISRRPVVYECSDACHCPLTCPNRLTQKGTQFHFEVFRTVDRGWGLRCWDPIRAGMFICEYTGEVIDELNVDLDSEEDDYIFQTACPGEKTLKWNYGPELIGEHSGYGTSEAFEPLSVRISAKSMGNVSRFMNHSCSPNVFWQPVQHDHGEDGHPHIMFFALKHIPPMTELTYDYGISSGTEWYSSVGPRSVKKCLCGVPKCRGYFG